MSYSTQQPKRRLTLVVGVVRGGLVVAHVAELRIVLVLLVKGLLGLSRGRGSVRRGGSGLLRLVNGRSGVAAGAVRVVGLAV